MALTNFPNGISTGTLATTGTISAPSQSISGLLNAGTVAVGTGTPIKGVLLNQPTLTPASVAAATTAEQAFAVAGVLATDVVLAVNKPTEQAGLGIAGQRVVAAGTVGITFINATAGAIVPTAGEVYDILTLSH